MVYLLWSGVLSGHFALARQTGGPEASSRSMGGVKGGMAGAGSVLEPSVLTSFVSVLVDHHVHEIHKIQPTRHTAGAACACSTIDSFRPLRARARKLRLLVQDSICLGEWSILFRRQLRRVLLLSFTPMMARHDASIVDARSVFARYQ